MLPDKHGSQQSDVRPRHQRKIFEEEVDQINFISQIEQLQFPEEQKSVQFKYVDRRAQTEFSEGEQDVPPSEVQTIYKTPVTNKLKTKPFGYHTYRTEISVEDESKIHSMVRPKYRAHQLKSPLKQEFQNFNNKEGLILKFKLNKKQKLFYGILKDGCFQLFDKDQQTIMKFTIIFKQIRCQIDMIKGALQLKIIDTPYIFYFSHQNLQEVKEWYIAFNFQIRNCKLLKSNSNIIRQTKLWKSHFIGIKDFENMVENLDIILFKSSSVAGSIQRVVTNSDYDHVAMVLRSTDDELFLYEANSDDGVGIWQWKNFIQFKYYQQFSKVVLRKVRCQRTFEKIETLQKFVRASLGKRYCLTFSKLMKKKSELCGDGKFPENRTFFCSELVAAALKTVNLLPTEMSSTQYWPKDFSQQKQLKLINGAYFSHEMTLQFDQE